MTRSAAVPELAVTAVGALVLGPRVPGAVERIGAAIGVGASAGTSGARGLDDLVLDTATIIGGAAAVWIALLGAVALVCRALGTSLPRPALRLAPRHLRPALAALAGGAVLATLPVTPALARTVPADPYDHARTHDAAASAEASRFRTAIAGLPLPDRPSGPAVRPAGPRPTSTSTASTYRVRQGDSLWTIAATDLRRTGRSAGPHDVDAAWRRWYRANRDVVGTNPDRLVAGTVLRRPAPLDRSPADPPH